MNRDDEILFSAALVCFLQAVQNTQSTRTRLTKKTRGKTRQWILRRQDLGCFSNLRNELMLEDPKRFKRWLRVDECAFNELLGLIVNDIKKQNTKFGNTISPNDRLTITLRFLAAGGTFRNLESAFRVGERTASAIVLETCKALYKHLRYTFDLPTTREKWIEIAKEFEYRWNFPHCLGAIDGKHVKIRKPIGAGSTYFNYKGTNSIVLMAVVDANYKFRYIDVGTEGRVSDGGVWNKCKLSDMLPENKVNMPEPGLIRGCSEPLPYVFVADDAFGMKNWLMKPYKPRPREELTEEERIFNYRLSRSRRMVESAFGIWSNRFRLFLGEVGLEPSIVRVLIMASCALHNFLRDRYGTFCWPVDLTDRDDLDAGTTSSGLWRRELENANQTQLQQMTTNHSNNHSLQAKIVRDRYKEYFNSPEGAVPWQSKFLNRY